jgi:hypothetical protein
VSIYVGATICGQTDLDGGVAEIGTARPLSIDLL